MSKLQKTVGVILNTLKFRDRDHILTLFSPDFGMLKLIHKGRGKSPLVPSQFTSGEFVYFVGKSDLYRCSEITIHNHNLKLRERLSSIEAACDLAKAVQATQLAGKRAPKLYSLFTLYINHLPEMEAPHILVSSFLLKVLRYEGLLTHDEPHFTEDEAPLVQVLAYSRKFSDLATLILSPDLKKKIDSFFSVRIG